MTYQAFIRRSRRSREAATPDIREKLPLPDASEAAPGFRRIRLIYSGAAVLAAVAVLCSSLLAVTLRNRAPLTPVSPESVDSVSGVVSGVQSLPEPDESSPLPITSETLPPAFDPGKVTLCSVLYDTAIIGGQELIGGMVGTRYLNFSSAYTTQPGHENCSGVYYDRQTESIFCCDHTVRAILKERGISGSDKSFYTHYFQPSLGLVLFTLSTSGHPTYICDLNARTVYKTSRSLYHCPGHVGGFNENLPDVPYYATMDGAGTGLLLVDLRTGKVTDLMRDSANKVIDSNTDMVWLSPAGGYVRYVRGDKDAYTKRQKNVVYCIATGARQVAVGEVMAWLPDDSRLVLETENGVTVFDCATGKTVSFADSGLPTARRYTVNVSEAYTDDCQKLVLTDRSTGKTTPVSNRYIHAYVRSADGEYLYYYVRGDDHVTCRQVTTGKEFSMAVGSAFLQAQERYKNNMIFYELQLDKENKTLYLSYAGCQRPAENPEAVRQERENDPSLIIRRDWENGTIRSIPDLLPLLTKHEIQPLFCSTSDYACLDFTRLYSENMSNKLVLYEDYRAGRCYWIVHNRSSYTSVFSSYETSWPLAADSAEKTKTVAAAQEWPVTEWPVDYGQYIKDGKVDTQAVEAVVYDPAWFEQQNRVIYFIYKGNDDTASRCALEGEKNVAELTTLVKELNGLNGRSYTTVEPASFSGREYVYSFRIDVGEHDRSFDIRLLQRDGNYYWVYEKRMALCSKEEAERWMPWMEQQWKKGFVDPYQ